MGECRKQHDQKPHNFNSCNVIRMRRIEKDGMGREYSKNGRDENAQKTMLGKPEGKHTCRREDNIKKEILKN